MKSVKEIASDLFPGKMVKVKEEAGKAVPTFNVWTKEESDKRGKLSAVISFPSFHMSNPSINLV